MKYCSRIRIDRMLANGMVTGVTLLDVSQVDDAHDFGLHQEPEAAYSPVTQRPITVFRPVLHFEGKNPDELLKGSTDE